MADFRKRQRWTTRRPWLIVAAGLPPGVHIFSLVIEDSGGKRSRPTTLRLEIVAGSRPVAR